jgi:SAM-dependent methyltransferase
MPDVLLPTFRDPEGSLVLREDCAIRTVYPHAKEATLRFIRSEFYRRASQRGNIVSTSFTETSEGLELQHPRIPIPTYPWEWTPSQWERAADLTLSLCEEALQAGWVLKDATPLNILFVGSNPVLVDVLSFDVREPSSSIWLAYGQFVRTFLLPLLMGKLLQWPLTLSFFKRDGYEPAELYPQLSWRQRLSPSAFWHISLPSWFERRSATKQMKPQGRPGTDPQVAADVLSRSLRSLRRHVMRSVPKNTASGWADYNTTLTHYTAEQHAAKQQWLRNTLAQVAAKHVLDVGANTGEYSALAAKAGANVVALERDAASAEQIFCMASAEKLPIQTIHADFARPTPSAGWENGESASLLSRLEGQFDLVLMLAVIHHLILLDQVPLSAIMKLCHRLTNSYLIVEWVPPSDPMYQDLMRGRDELYGNISEADFEAACSGMFQVVQQKRLENNRTLYLLERAS